MTVYHHEYDEDGRPVRTISIPEAEWSRADVALLIASRQREKEIGAHGIPMSEATDPKNQFGFTTGLVMDWAERSRLDAIEAHKKKNPKQNLNGLMFPVRRRAEN